MIQLTTPMLPDSMSLSYLLEYTIRIVPYLASSTPGWQCRNSGLAQPTVPSCCGPVRISHQPPIPAPRHLYLHLYLSRVKACCRLYLSRVKACCHLYLSRVKACCHLYLSRVKACCHLYLSHVKACCHLYLSRVKACCHLQQIAKWLSQASLTISSQPSHAPRRCVTFNYAKQWP